MSERKQMIMPRAFADNLMDSLTTLYIFASMSVQGRSLEDEISSEVWESAENYARSKFLGLTAEFELGDYSWDIV